MSCRPAPFIVSLAIHGLIIALCFPVLVDRRPIHQAIPVDFVLISAEKKQESRVEHAVAPPLRSERNTVTGKVPERPREIPQRTNIAAQPRAGSEARLPASVADAPVTQSSGQVEAGGAVAVVPLRSGEAGTQPGGGASDRARLARLEATGSGAQTGTQDGWRAAIQAELRRTVERNKVYPDRARRMGWEGKVELTFRVFEDGTIRDIAVAKSSGYQALDDAAKDAVRRSKLTYRPAEKISVVLPIEYRLQ